MTNDCQVRECTTDLHVLITPQQWVGVYEALRATKSGAVEIVGVFAQELSFSCEPDNMLVTQFEQHEGHVPLAEVLHRVVVLSVSSCGLQDLTSMIVDVIAAQVDTQLYWYGTSVLGHSDPSASSVCKL